MLYGPYAAHDAEQIRAALIAKQIAFTERVDSRLQREKHARWRRGSALRASPAVDVTCTYFELTVEDARKLEGTLKGFGIGGRIASVLDDETRRDKSFTVAAGMIFLGIVALSTAAIVYVTLVSLSY